MEKHTPHYKLFVIQQLVADGKVKPTQSALSGAAALGIELSEMLAVIQNLTAKDFYKSMTSRKNHKVWQDVYRPVTAEGKIYLKLTVLDDVLIVSFKEL